MTATLAPPRPTLKVRAFESADLWYPTRAEPIGPQVGYPGNGEHPPHWLLYLVWVDAGRWYPTGELVLRDRGGASARSGPELAPRLALHVTARRSP